MCEQIASLEQTILFHTILMSVSLCFLGGLSATLNRFFWFVVKKFIMFSTFQKIIQIEKSGFG